MKLSKLMWGLMAAAAFSACSNDDIVPDGDNNQIIDGESRFLAVQIANPATARTRAGGDQSGNLFEEGFTAENKANTLRFYFFNKEKGAYSITSDDKNYCDCTPENLKDNSDMPNIEDKLKAVIVINTKKGDKVNGDLTSMVALVNVPEETLKDMGNMTLAQLKAKFADYSYENQEKSGFLMTSSTFGSEDFNCEVEVPAGKLKASSEAAEADPVQVYVERVLAKARLNTVWNDDTKKESVTYKDASYDAVKLYDKDNIEIKVGEDNIYVLFTGWNVTSTANQSYLFKNVDSNWTLGWDWQAKENHRSYWAENPENTTLQYIPYTGINKTIGFSQSKYNTSEIAYCQENAAAYNENGLKPFYEPAEEVGNRTQAILAGVLVTVKDGVATPVSLAKWGNVDYTEESVKTAMLNAVGTHRIYIKSEEKGDNGEDKYVTIPVDMVKLVTGEKALAEIKDGKEVYKADEKTEDSKRYLSYLQLDPEKTEEVTFYKDNEGKETYAKEDVNIILSGTPGAKVWSSGMTYYYTDIEHEKTAGATKGKYGVVRNHIYEIAINSVKGLGTPVLDKDENIIPQKPENDESYLAAQINILSWRVVQQDVDLEW